MVESPDTCFWRTYANITQQLWSCELSHGGMIVDQMLKSGLKIKKIPKKKQAGVFVLPHPEQSSKSDQKLQDDDEQRPTGHF